MKKQIYFVILLFLAIIFLSLTLSAIVAVINIDFVEENLLWIILTAMGLVVSGVMGYAFIKEIMDVIEEDKQITKFKKDNENGSKTIIKDTELIPEMPFDYKMFNK